ncbi:MAG: transketolase [Candidatus Eisenbacteria bacterium]|uniref:Transketolase n=1 Tax=Eiseniibacteriota bacterium TaxID=2212470 RepID=A0A538TJS4_UNCEI|nr:MAG: transketolase [Candidatus Eisenbacteria bacterium]
MPAISVDIEQLCVNTIKFLSVDAVERAKSGHPGAPMGAADMAFVLWAKFLHFDPSDPAWVNRDRFVLSAGHASMLLYSLLHLFGFDLPMEELRRFRQWESRTPGHPEHGITPGVEATTGPLGQGFGNGVGMALAQRMVRARFPRLGPLLDGRVFGIVSDGDLMEGVASEAASLAGHWGLGNLVYLYDDNHVSIEGPTTLAFSEDVGLRFEAYRWHVQRIDGQDRGQVEVALRAAIAEEDRPSIIIARTTIGKGAPTKEGTAKTHGEPLGPDETKRAKEAVGWPLEPAFFVPDEARDYFKKGAEEKRRHRAAWEERWASLRAEAPEEASRWDALFGRAIPDDLEARLAAAVEPALDLATRTWSGRVIQAAAEAVPSLVGGSADLAPSTITDIGKGGSVAPAGLKPGAPIEFAGRTLHFGVREHGMGAIVNGMALHGAFLPFGATFLIFSDYMRPAIRLAALTGLRSIFVFTHDSVFLGEDGPTHQPVEQLASLRLIPNIEVWRPADGPETAAAWASALRRSQGPSALALTRQKLHPLARAGGAGLEPVLRGGYVLQEAAGARAHAILVASGSETPLAQDAAAILAKRGIPVRVVSMPCVERFQGQPEAYRRSVLPEGARYVVIEAAQTDLWCALVGSEALRLGLNRFGASAPGETIAEKLGFTPEAVARRISLWLRPE